MYKNEWKQKYNIGDRIFADGHDEPLYIVSVKACSGHDSIWLEYTIGDSMPQPYFYPKTFILNEKLLLTEQEFKDKKIKLAKEMLEKYGN